MANKIPDDKLRDARAEAARQLANRERRDGLFALFDALRRAREFLDETSVDSRLVAPGTYAVRIVDKVGYDEARRLGEEEKRIKLETETYSAYVIVSPANGEAFDRLGKQCALAGEDLEAATNRILLERGASSYQIAKLISGDIKPNSKSRAARRAQSDRLKQLTAVRAATELLVKRHLPVSGRVGWERYGAELDEKIGKLSVDRKSPKKRKSSSRKRR